jgi:hypothetical protein
LVSRVICSPSLSDVSSLERLFLFESISSSSTLNFLIYGEQRSKILSGFSTFLENSRIVWRHDIIRSWFPESMDMLYKANIESA